MRRNMTMIGAQKAMELSDPKPKEMPEGLTTKNTKSTKKCNACLVAILRARNTRCRCNERAGRRLLLEWLGRRVRSS